MEDLRRDDEDAGGKEVIEVLQTPSTEASTVTVTTTPVEAPVAAATATTTNLSSQGLRPSGLAAFAVPRSMGPLSTEPSPEDRALVDKMQNSSGGVDVRDRTWFLKTFKRCFLGSEAVAWLAKHWGISCIEAQMRGQRLLRLGFISHVIEPEKPLVDGNSFYRFHTVPTFAEIENLVNDDWILSMLELLDIPGVDAKWEYIKEAKGSRLYTRAIPDCPLRAVKVATTTKAPISSLLDLLHFNMIQRHKEWSPTFMEGKVLLQVTNDVNVQVWRYELKGAKNREFVVVRRVVKFADGAMAICERSIDHGLVPSTKAYIRCSLDFNVRYFSPSPTNKNENILIYMNLTDVKGWIPSWLSNVANQDISLEEIELIKACAENSSPNPTLMA